MLGLSPCSTNYVDLMTHPGAILAVSLACWKYWHWSIAEWYTLRQKRTSRVTSII